MIVLDGIVTEFHIFGRMCVSLIFGCVMALWKKYQIVIDYLCFICFHIWFVDDIKDI